MTQNNERPSWLTPDPNQPNYNYGAHPGPYSQPPISAPRPKRSSLGRLIGWSVVGFLGFILICGVVAAIADPHKTAQVPPLPNTYATATPTKRTPPLVAAGLSDGTWIVGKEVQPGRYWTAVPDGALGCYWARLSDTDGELTSIIANEIITSGRALVTVKSSDFAVEIKCGDAQWKLLGK